MKLFDEMDRTDGLPRAQETQFAYLNRSARPEASRIRQFLTECGERYPAEARAGLISRIRGDDEGHYSAVFELLVHELLIRAGFKILAVEPTLPHTSKSPDFLVEAPDGTQFYLECVVSSGRSDKDNAAQKRLDDAIDAAASVPSPAHFLSVKVSGRPTEPVRLSNLKRGLKAWIASLPAGTAAKRARPFAFSQSGLKLQFSVMMERRSARPEGDRTLGAVHHGILVRRPGDDLRSSLNKKANRYGTLELPYVVAVNNSEVGSTERDLLDALLGTPAIAFDREGRVNTEYSRADDGVWTAGKRPRKRGLSAVWSFDAVTAWRPGGRGARLIRNPWADRPLPPVPLAGDELNPRDGEFVRDEGTSALVMLGLDQDWPE